MVSRGEKDLLVLGEETDMVSERSIRITFQSESIGETENTRLLLTTMNTSLALWPRSTSNSSSFAARWR